VKVLRLDEVEATPIMGSRWIPIRSTLGIESFGIKLEATPGTLVFVEDPVSRRGAVAAAPGTRLLAVGAPVGEPYQSAPWEARFLEARTP